MSYTVPECFMAAFAAGLMFSLVYEALRIVRVIFPFRIVVFVCDVVFFLLAALAVTRLSMALGDHIRWSTVFGFGAGIFAYINTLGRLLNLLENAVANAVRTALSAVFNTARRIASKFFGIIAHTVSDVFGEINKIHLSYVKKHRKPLQNSHEIVYNKESSEDNSGGSETGHVIKAQVRRSVNT